MEGMIKGLRQQHSRAKAGDSVVLESGWFKGRERLWGRDRQGVVITSGT